MKEMMDNGIVNVLCDSDDVLLIEDKMDQKGNNDKKGDKEKDKKNKTGKKDKKGKKEKKTFKHFNKAKTVKKRLGLSIDKHELLVADA